MFSGAEANPNAWTISELIAICLCASLYFSSLLYSIWKACRSRKGRWYWIGCAGLIIVGTAGMVFAVPDSPSSGEMPRQFGLGASLMILGLLGVALAVIRHVLRRIFGRLRPTTIP
ncbi:hypothetical protein [Glaciimonas sp. PAMC28666]|uniref:hypothetical protein n=1 Tax=Glaciimonas sp. PAMC28666 TaxID=2807626 RepID=UPI001964FB14|nr:hypothetical protein [Glaciimonas sp. PAMC28666]QRX84170.1 hypothetical protein JQN73_08270 [Glaciimonas sp. PAMC28666]